MPQSLPQSSAGLGLSFAHNVCAEILNAQKKGLLTSKQDKQYALQAELLMKAFEQHDRAACNTVVLNNQCEKKSNIIDPIVMACVDKKLKPYVASIPNAFYQELFRLHGLSFDNDAVLRPIHFGMLINDLIFKRLSLETATQLKTKLRKNDSSKVKKRKNNILKVAYAKLHQHIGESIAMMKLSDTFDVFKEKINRLSPLSGETLTFAFEDDLCLEDGVVL